MTQQNAEPTVRPAHPQDPACGTAPHANAPTSPARRHWLKGMSLAAGSLLIPVTATWVGSPSARAAGANLVEINDWIRIDADGTTVLGLSQCEVGQGVYTGLPQVLADELDADWRRVRVEFVTARDAYRTAAANEALQQFVGASMSATLFYERLRVAGAQAREALVAVGAKRLGVRTSNCVTRDGRVIHPQSGRSIGYGELVADAAKQPLNPHPHLKNDAAHRLIGQSLARLDTPSKVDGSAIFGIDVKVPDMLVGAVRMAPTSGGAPRSVRNRDAIRARKGVHDVVLAKDAVIVVADDYWRAKTACDALDVEWKAGPAADSATILAERRAALVGGKAGVATDIGDATGVIAAGGKVVTSEYHTPYIVHATMEPVNATVHVRKDKGEIEVWGPIQGQDKVRWALGGIFKLPPEKVTVHTTFLGGSFGRKYVPDFVIHAAVASAAVGRPVKVIRSREDDIRHGFYRPCASARFQAALGSDGLPVALHMRVAGQSLYNVIKKDHFEKAGYDETMLDGLYDLAYAVPNLRVEGVDVPQPNIPVSFMRSVGSTSSVFFLESFIDEMAEVAGIDPVDYRKRMLRHDPLATRVIETTFASAGWQRKAKPDVHRGFGYCTYTGRGTAFSTYVAVAVELRVVNDRFKIERVVCGVDCGRAINPNLIRANIEGGIGFALTNTFKSRITFADGGVAQSNFGDYPLLYLVEMPKIETVILPSDRPPQGCGEVSLPPMAPAVAQAIRRATGVRARTMPLPQTVAEARALVHAGTPGATPVPGAA
ncbi:Isoquinoline 1-oxidoreductase subunit beta [Pandoraea pnomenusa]|jgi:isoquinoline 1-oxidoreductase beta subunit|uniref:Isoquinoline 1-oxidoreductase subunit beta n=2 Tax=Burkholderiaceae TaxID=119060 RepID=A0ABY6WMD5_9BURK|nr:acylaldehyde oxidase [Pandoraea pnomenusa]MBN9093345.1 xanthine dehydrogenase family protein molybdopterin-binding subunit [Pandoraea pnomenusa]VVE69494.1 Isoquinoline 1-oxidoreductase subunit beta [Pandoraea pnomenusa]